MARIVDESFEFVVEDNEAGRALIIALDKADRAIAERERAKAEQTEAA